MSRFVFHVDPGAPLSWKKQPYYSQLKRLAQNGVEHNGIVTVNIGKRTIVILPDEDIDLGVCQPTDKILLKKYWDGLSYKYEAYKTSPET